MTPNLPLPAALTEEERAELSRLLRNCKTLLADVYEGRVDGTLSRIDAAINLLSRTAVPAGEWQPIETAPKDGREVWVSVDGRYVAKAWLFVSRGDYWEGDSKHPMPVQPDHWMPCEARPAPYQPNEVQK